MTWYNSYTGFPYKHLGDKIDTGIDCFNLCRLVYKEKLNINIDYDTSHFCKIVDEHTKLMDKHEKVFKEIHNELRLYNFSLDITQPPTTTTTSTSTNSVITPNITTTTSGTFKILDEIIKSKKKLDKKSKKYKYNVIKLKKEKKDDSIN